MTLRANVGDWVEIGAVVLEAGQRAPQVPDDTQQLALEMRVRGRALQTAELGSELRIRSAAGRELRGELRAVCPAYSHGYGAPAAELLAIGAELRALLDEAGPDP